MFQSIVLLHAKLFSLNCTRLSFIVIEYCHRGVRAGTRRLYLITVRPDSGWNLKQEYIGQFNWKAGGVFRTTGTKFWVSL